MDQTTPVALQALAAVVEAGTAVVIVVLTRRLTSTAKNALRATEAQAQAAARSIDEVQRQGQLDAIPLLALERPTYSYSGKLDLQLMITNSSGSPALGVAMSALQNTNPRSQN